MIREILTISNNENILRKPCSPVVITEKPRIITDKTAQIVKELVMTAMATKNCAGLAAPQIGYLSRIFVINLGSIRPRIFINPKITKRSEGTTTALEGCLSIPNKQYPVKRNSAIEIVWDFVDSFSGRMGEDWFSGITVGSKVETCTDVIGDIEARVIQHEMDHLDGILISDKQGWR